VTTKIVDDYSDIARRLGQLENKQFVPSSPPTLPSPPPALPMTHKYIAGDTCTMCWIGKLRREVVTPNGAPIFVCDNPNCKAAF
jgi:hypothetical protein